MNVKSWIGVDLDGTLAEYDGWRGVEHIGAPIPAMVERVKQWLSEGKEVRIFTARVYPFGTRDDDYMPERAKEGHKALQLIQNWCAVHIGQKLAVTCVKDFGMIELWDDRAFQVERNTGRVASL